MGSGLTVPSSRKARERLSGTHRGCMGPGSTLRFGRDDRGRLVAGLLVALFASPALAATPVELRDHPVSYGRSVTLGDLFDGASGSAASMVVAHAPAAGLEAVLDASRVQVAAGSVGLVWANPQGVRRILVLSQAADDASPRPTRVAARARKAEQVLVWSRALNTGDVVQAADLEWSDQAIPGGEPIGDPDRAIGRAARRPLRPGAAVSAGDLVAAKLVRRDETVSVAFREDGVVLTLQAKALGDAGVGEVVQVMNPGSRKILQAVVTGPDEAEVGPAAEPARSSLRTAALR